MQKDFTKKKSTIKQSSPRLWARVLSMMLISMTIIGAGFFVYKHKKTTLESPAMLSYLSRISDWVNAHRHARSVSRGQDLAKAKTMPANQDESATPIHFEFYTALPSMRVDLPEAVQKEAKPAEPNANPIPKINLANKSKEE